mmetsp:Transcript_32567/g.46971  ORF Transcript_32567/g.46971 Transcript_32567/m.46971 type:complete len:487 (+) Transcript_32567:45-1505(+)
MMLFIVIVSISYTSRTALSFIESIKPKSIMSSRDLSVSALSNSRSNSVDFSSWDSLKASAISSPTGQFLQEQEELRAQGAGLPHTDAKIRLFGSTGEPRITYFRDSAAWCPYCQKVWILLEEKKIPYKVEKINMRSYGDKPAAFLRMVPNGLLPAVIYDNKEVQTESLDIMLTLDRMFTGEKHPKMWPNEKGPEYARATRLMKLERLLFGLWCDLIFRPSFGGNARKRFEDCLDEVNEELCVCEGPWFLSFLSIVDLTFVTHVERMCASAAYWGALNLRGQTRWVGIERWLQAFEALPSYQATKSDYFTHVMDIPPQYGPAYPNPGWEAMSGIISGRGSAWKLPLPPLSPEALEPHLDPGEEPARHEAAFKLVRNHEAVVKFALRGAGQPGAKRFQAPLADPYAVPNLKYLSEMDQLLRTVVAALLGGVHNINPNPNLSLSQDDKKNLIACVTYLRDRIGVPRDMSYPAARQLRAHLNWIADNLLT